LSIDAIKIQPSKEKEMKLTPILLAVAALAFGATAMTSGVAVAKFDGYSNKSPVNCGVAPCAIPDYPGGALIPSYSSRGR